MAWIRVETGKHVRLTPAQTRLMSRLLVADVITQNSNRLRTLAILDDLGLVEQASEDRWRLTGYGRRIALELESR
ncbi:MULTISPECIES: hypothetical protein [Bifidobacterium]|uniref:Uncharacterized protein n=2 Tax=Bifidobacterium TaxID=1678 RepID=A0A086ZU44_9BIFI|nr:MULTISPECIES: hypothetical protein [Bifidobacterium]KFI50044.1 hypothetical protein BBIA_2177 [Bifidobacterium biavatii DSM 23969]MBW3093078.1 hypothetical protein [Bifidobacterium miconis]